MNYRIYLLYRFHEKWLIYLFRMIFGFRFKDSSSKNLKIKNNRFHKMCSYNNSKLSKVSYKHDYCLIDLWISYFDEIGYLRKPNSICLIILIILLEFEKY